MGKYAAGTSVNIERSREELERILARYGADEFMYAISQGTAAIGFKFMGVAYKIDIPMPRKESFESTPTGRRSRSDRAVIDAWDQSKRQVWRALVLFIKGKLEGIEQGFSTIEKEFLSNIMLPDGSKFGDLATEAVQKAVSSGQMPQISFMGNKK